VLGDFFAMPSFFNRKNLRISQFFRTFAH
jgi:hypothetical protein